MWEDGLWEVAHAVIEGVDLGGDEVLALALGNSSTCVLVAPDRVRCWGYNASGQSGQGDTVQIGDDELPGAIDPVDLGAAITQIDANNFHVCARTSDGTLRCWGDNGWGQLGYGGLANIGDDEKPGSAGPVPFL